MIWPFVAAALSAELKAALSSVMPSPLAPKSKIVGWALVVVVVVRFRLAARAVLAAPVAASKPPAARRLRLCIWVSPSVVSDRGFDSVRVAALSQWQRDQTNLKYGQTSNELCVCNEKPFRNGFAKAFPPCTEELPCSAIEGCRIAGAVIRREA